MVPILTPQHKALRFQWYRDTQGIQWERCIFSDESAFVICDVGGGTKYVTRLRGEGRDSDCLCPVGKRFGMAVMVWGAIALGHKGPLY